MVNRLRAEITVFFIELHLRDPAKSVVQPSKLENTRRKRRSHFFNFMFSGAGANSARPLQTARGVCSSRALLLGRKRHQKERRKRSKKRKLESEI